MTEELSYKEKRAIRYHELVEKAIADGVMTREQLEQLEKEDHGRDEEKMIMTLEEPGAPKNFEQLESAYKSLGAVMG